MLGCTKCGTTWEPSNRAYHTIGKCIEEKQSIYGICRCPECGQASIQGGEPFDDGMYSDEPYIMMFGSDISSEYFNEPRFDLIGDKVID